MTTTQENFTGVTITVKTSGNAVPNDGYSYDESALNSEWERITEKALEANFPGATIAFAEGAVYTRADVWTNDDYEGEMTTGQIEDAAYQVIQSAGADFQNNTDWDKFLTEEEGEE